MIIETSRFGQVEVNDENLLTFPGGILGFESILQYCLVRHAPESPFYWLQAIGNPALAFIVVNPFDFILDYNITISGVDTAHLRLASPEEVRVLSIVTIADGEITTDLVGPIVVNHRLRLARQIVLSDACYETRHALVMPTRRYSAVA
jgi:flagellar assembly factor FliW